MLQNKRKSKDHDLGITEWDDSIVFASSGEDANIMVISGYLKYKKIAISCDPVPSNAFLNIVVKNTATSTPVRYSIFIMFWLRH